MKAFLCHSSQDKPIVDEVANSLGWATCELDANTFDRGLLTSAAIVAALKRSSIFVLFLSADSAKSPFVKYEVFNAEELHAKGTIDRILVICRS